MVSKINRKEEKVAMNCPRTELIRKLGINTKTSKEPGSIGGEMVRRMIEKQKEQMK